MKDAIYRKIPERSNYHNPSIRNRYGNTVAMWLASYGIIPPK